MAAESVFRIREVADCFPLDHTKDLHAIFTREGVLKRTVHSVWGCDGHLFVALEGGTFIRAYQIKGATPIKQFSLLAKISPVVQLCFAKDTQDVILVFHKNGLVKVYEHFRPADPNTQPWKKRAQFNLGTYTHNASVKSALCCSAGGMRLVWQEERREARESGSREVTQYCLLTAELEPYCKNIRNPVLVLSHCPTPLDVVATQNGDHITVLPSHPSPHGLYFKLHVKPAERSLELASSILGEGCVQRDTSFPINFTNHADSLVHIWSEVGKHPYGNLVAMAIEAKGGQLFLISSDGTVHAVSQQEGEAETSFHLDGVETSEVAAWFAHRFVLGAVCANESKIRIYSSASGQLLQEMDLSPVTSALTVNSWCMMGSPPQTGFWTKDGIWILQVMQEASTAAVADEANSTRNLVSFGLGRLAASRELQRAVAQSAAPHTGDQDIAEAGSPECELLRDERIFQNDALLLSLLQEMDQRKEPEVMARLKELQEAFEQRNPTADTTLNESILPLIREFWKIQSKRQGMAEGAVQSTTGPSISSEVKDALREESAIPIDLRLDRLELLSRLFPERLLECLYMELDVEKMVETAFPVHDKTDTTAGEETSHGIIRHHLFCNSETDEGARLIKLLCRLLFLYQPANLVAVVRFFQWSHPAAADTSAFTRRRHGLSISSLVLDVLPDPSQSVNVKEAVLAQASLIQDSDQAHGSMRALQLLLGHSLWAEAMGVLEAHHHHDNQAHRELFYVLLTAMLMDSTAFRDHSQQLWKCLPPSISALNLLQTLQVNQDQMENQLSLQRDLPREPMHRQGLTTALLKEQLIEMLAHESV